MKSEILTSKAASGSVKKFSAESCALSLNGATRQIMLVFRHGDEARYEVSQPRPFLLFRTIRHDGLDFFPCGFECCPRPRDILRRQRTERHVHYSDATTDPEITAGSRRSSTRQTPDSCEQDRAGVVGKAEQAGSTRQPVRRSGDRRSAKQWRHVRMVRRS